MITLLAERRNASIAGRTSESLGGAAGRTGGGRAAGGRAAQGGVAHGDQGRQDLPKDAADEGKSKQSTNADKGPL